MSFRRVIAILAVLILPSLFYLWIIRGKNNYNTLEILGPKILQSNGDTLYHTIPEFDFINQYGEHITSNNVAGKIYVADFFFTTCQTICKDMSDQMFRLQEEYKNDPEVVLLSHSVDPENDTVEVLLNYAEKYKATRGKWHFLTGSRESIYTVCQKGYFMVAEEAKTGPDAFIHSNQFTLVDKEGRIRGFYDGTDVYDVKKLIEDIRVLKYEYKKMSL